MKKKVFKVLLSTMVMVSLLGTTCFAAFDGELDNELVAGGQVVEGTSDIKNPIYSIAIPTEFDFSVDAFEQGGQSQIYSEDFNIINKSNVNVRVNVNAKATVVNEATPATLKATEAEVTETNTDKLMYLAIEVPSVVTETTTANQPYTTPLYTNTAGIVYKTDDSSAGQTALEEMTAISKVEGNYATSAKAGLTTEGKDYLFVLKAADYIEYINGESDGTEKAYQYKSIASETDGTTTFRFSGKVNSKATWVANEVKVTANYTFLGLSDTNYSALMEKEVTNSHAYVVEETLPAFSSSAAGVISYVDGSAGNELFAVTKLEGPWDDGTFDACTVADSVTVDKSAKTITISESLLGNWASNYAEDEDGKLDFEITYTYGAEGANEKTETVSVVIFTVG